MIVDVAQVKKEVDSGNSVSTFFFIWLFFKDVVNNEFDYEYFINNTKLDFFNSEISKKYIFRQKWSGKMRLEMLNYVLTITKQDAKDKKRKCASGKDIKDREEDIRMNGGYEVLDIARYIVNYYIDAGNPLTNLKLQKLLYYVQGGFLIELNRPCFRNDIINWRLGPVVREAYDEFKCYGNQSIDIRQSFVEVINYDNKTGEITFEQKEFNINKICSDSDLKKLDSILVAYIHTSSFELVNKTHSENPWIETNQNEIISNERIRDYFRENPQRVRE